MRNRNHYEICCVYTLTSVSFSEMLENWRTWFESGRTFLVPDLTKPGMAARFMIWCPLSVLLLLAPHFGNSTTFSENRYGGYTVPVRRTHGPYPRTVPTYRTHVPYPRTVPIPYRTQKHVPTYRTHTQKHVPTYRTVPNPPRYVHRTPPWCSDRKPWFHNS